MDMNKYGQSTTRMMSWAGGPGCGQIEEGLSGAESRTMPRGTVSPSLKRIVGSTQVELI